MDIFTIICYMHGFFLGGLDEVALSIHKLSLVVLSCL